MRFAKVNSAKAHENFNFNRFESFWGHDDP